MERAPSKKRKVLFTSFGVFLLFLLVFVIFFFFNFRTVVVRGESMVPTFQQGERLLVSRAYWLVGDIRRNDIVVIETDDDVIIKRVYALAGETVDLLNAPRDPAIWRFEDGDFVVPPGMIYVLGDNWPASQDSRHLGPFPMEKVMGKVVVVRLGVQTARPAVAEQ